MGIFASKKRSNAFAERDRIILQLKMQRDEVKQKIKKYEADIARLVRMAKDLVHEGKKDKALSTLRKKKFMENTVNNLDKQLEEVENMATQLEFTQIEMQVLENLKAGNQVLDKLHKMMSIEDVEKIMEETKEGVAYQREIDEILARELNEEDEEDIEKEFDEMIRVQIEDLPVVGDGVQETVQGPEKVREKPKKIAVAAS